jgi:hypothetical protein
VKVNEEKAASKLAEVLLFALDFQDAHQVGGAGYSVSDTADGFRPVQSLLAIGVMQRCDPRIKGSGRRHHHCYWMLHGDAGAEELSSSSILVDFW